MYRQQQLNVPIEIARTIVAISETGSLSKAAEKLGLSQPAVSSQIKRIQSLLGTAIFTKTANGTTSTPLGRLVLTQARKMLEANDQMLRLGGSAGNNQPIRLGMSSLFLKEFLQHKSAETLTDVVLHVDNSLEIYRGLVEGYIDVACIYENSEICDEVRATVIKECSEPYLWVRSKSFVLRPGSPIPLVTWPGFDLTLNALARLGVAYKIVFSSPGFHTKLEAIEAGLGVAGLPARLVPESLVHAKEYYLPELPVVKALLCVRPEVDEARCEKLTGLLSSLFFLKRQPTKEQLKSA